MNTNEPPNSTHEAAVRRAQEAISKIDFRGFWPKVLAETDKESDAYYLARCRSRGRASTTGLR